MITAKRPDETDDQYDCPICFTRHYIWQECPELKDLLKLRQDRKRDELSKATLFHEELPW